MLEIVRMRDLFDEVESDRVVVQRCWEVDVGDQLVALEKLRVLMMQKVSMRGLLGVRPARVASTGAAKIFPLRDKPVADGCATLK
ncbi:hypothetical protein PQR34_42515 [Paraburkholderia sediminicola]|uniref:hypothetical protein n=1 Tax=Paraburkholderia sediminicola TaxID=458836 RepID=UPI0038BBF40E